MSLWVDAVAEQLNSREAGAWIANEKKKLKMNKKTKTRRDNTLVWVVFWILLFWIILLSNRKESALSLQIPLVLTFFLLFAQNRSQSYPSTFSETVFSVYERYPPFFQKHFYNFFFRNCWMWIFVATCVALFWMLHIRTVEVCQDLE